MRILIGKALLVTAAVLIPSLLSAHEPIHWSLDQPAGESYITGGPWTLEQSGASQDRRAAGYCDSYPNGKQQPNPGTMRMQPYYFPSIVGKGKTLQGYFDYRPRNIDEAIVAAFLAPSIRSLI